MPRPIEAAQRGFLRSRGKIAPGAAGCDYVLSIEREDSLASPGKGLQKAVRFPREALFREKPPNGMWRV